MTTISSLHERDCYGWVEQQCAAQRAHDSSRLDWDALQEELVSRLGVLLGHRLEQHPSLASKLDEALDPATSCDTRGDWTDLGL